MRSDNKQITSGQTNFIVRGSDLIRNLKQLISSLMRCRCSTRALIRSVPIRVFHTLASCARSATCAIGEESTWEWSVEVKMLCFRGDNGKPNDNILIHILSPYSQHRNALTDCSKLITSELVGRKAELIYGFESDSYPLEPAISAFEILASKANFIGRRHEAHFADLVHPYHQSGAVYGWEAS
jgi:hypothetical protein